MPADVCGPFTLEQLDLFGGNLDALPYSLDDPIWTLSTTCVLYGEGNVTGVGNVTASPTKTLLVSGDVNSNATVSAARPVAVLRRHPKAADPAVLIYRKWAVDLGQEVAVLHRWCRCIHAASTLGKF